MLGLVTVREEEQIKIDSHARIPMSPEVLEDKESVSTNGNCRSLKGKERLILTKIS